MKKGWKAEKLGDICTVLDKDRKPITKRDRIPGPFPYYGASGIVDYVADYLFDEDLLLVSEDGANLLARTYPIAFSINGKVWINNHAHVLKFREMSQQKFIEYYLNSISLDEYISGMAQPKLNQKLLRSIPIPLPPLSEQKRIVEILDEAFAAIDKATANTEKNIKNAEELFERKINLALSTTDSSWKKYLLSEVCSIVSKLVDPKQEAFLDLLHIGAGNMVSRSDELRNVMTSRQEGLISSKFSFDSRMVLYSKIRPYLEKVSRPEFDGLCSADVYPLLPFEGLLHRDFLFYLLRSSEFTNYAITGSARAGMPKVNRKHLFAYSFMLPSYNKQSRISSNLNGLSFSTNLLKEKSHKKKEILEELKQSILHKAFTGELTSDFKTVDKALSEAGV